MRLRRTGRAPRRLADNERRALELHDDIVQRFTAIHWALDAQDCDRAGGDRGELAQAQAMIGELLGDEAGAAFAPGSLRRRTGAGG